ncbi:uncharacterized protein FOMMEDRAFT_164039 [Fomitiporia mediterranea MF3/22]|uniref:Uncharacterized protein n=1 Tax=Fomitiporia mediterranea (strain MF3/22) TaxID=694068 RepID=R7SIA4_FOMME|nr:uncharacterized protein FOMMEDRAFT_164039 [Fomitiporia mediterranea MF3/22]EJC97304.1 hypothetical protein FOMMEDRAFT_164039 [Fomitiporia mediterranea MF3/22]
MSMYNHSQGTNTASPAAQIILLNAPDHDPGAPLTLATRHRNTSISSLQLATHINANTHTHTFSQTVSQLLSQVQPQPTQHAQPYNRQAHAIQLAGTERRPKRGDEDYIKRPENTSFLFRCGCCWEKNEARGSSSYTTSIVSVSSSASTADSDDYSKFDSLSADSSLYGCLFGYPHTTCSSDGSTADAVITVEPLNALAFGWSVWIWSRDGPGNRHP